MKKPIFKIIVLSALLLSPLFASAVSWPASFTRHSDITMAVSWNYEPSGLAWNSVTNKLLTVCNTGQVTIMNLDGTEQDTTRMPSYMDFEAITIVDPNTTKAFIGLENRDSILEYDWSERRLTGRTWDLTGVLTGADNQGLEGLTFVPNSYHPFAPSASGGLFYAGIQRPPVPGGAVNDDYLIYAFDIDLSTSGRIINWWGIPVPAGTPTSDISDLFFSKDTGVLYVLYDGANRLIEMTPDGRVLADYSNVPVADQEGVAVITNYPSETANIYLASDSTKLIGHFSGYPVTYYDADGDGVSHFSDCNVRDSSVSTNRLYYRDSDGDGVGSGVGESFCLSSPPSGYVSNPLIDCNDSDRTVSVNQNYYLDADGDGLGFGSAMSFCASVPPSGYVSNNLDTYPNDYDNDGVATSLDCDDRNPAISSGLIPYYLDEDGDGLGSDISILACATPSSGYVSNSDDANDNDHDNDGSRSGRDCDDNNPLYRRIKTYYEDTDRDGYGNPKISGRYCVPPANYVTNRRDCDDNSSLYHAIRTYYQDADGDGLGNRDVYGRYCVPPANYVTNRRDRDDSRPYTP
jgi:hypothetical protein